MREGKREPVTACEQRRELAKIGALAHFTFRRGNRDGCTIMRDAIRCVSMAQTGIHAVTIGSF